MGRIGNRGKDHGHIRALGGGDHDLGGIGGNGDDDIIAAGHHLSADLIQHGKVVLTVVYPDLQGNALFRGQGIQLVFNGNADLIQGRVIHLLHDGDLVAVAASVAACQQAKGHSQYQNQTHHLFHNRHSLFWKIKKPSFP